MDIKKLLGSKLYDVFSRCEGFMCVYDTGTHTVLRMNDSVQNHIGNSSEWKVNIVHESETVVYSTLNGIPCKMNVISDIEGNIKLMYLNLAHTKKWNRVSDIVSLIDTTSDGVWEWYPELDFEYMSKRFWDILGYDQKDMEENPVSWLGFINPEDKKSVMKMFNDHVESGGRKDYIRKVRYTHKDGNEVIILCRGTVVEWIPNGKPWRMMGTHTDVTDIANKDSIEAKSKFISRMSHEIRSPVCTILNECELLGGGERTKVIRDTCEQLISLTDDILSIDKSKSKEDKLNLKPENLTEVISKFIKRHNVQVKKRGLKMRSMVDEIPELVMMDRGKFNQVLDNIIGNSIKYSESGTIIVDMGYDEETCMCSVRITDEGRGIDPSFHARAFEELVQGDDTMMGAGIGLTICRILASEMGGNVTIERSSPGEGTTMLFTSNLPVSDGGEYDIDEKSSIGSSSIAKRFRVLLVDDIRTNREILRRRLDRMTDMGLNIDYVAEAVDGRDAVNKFMKEEGDFQLVLMDCHMPILDGFNATIQIHDHCSKIGIEAVPIVAVTASVSTDVYEKCISAGMKYVVTKPYSELDLMASIKSCIESNKM